MLYPNIEEIMKIIVEEGENRFTLGRESKTWTPYLKENILP
jgi:enoyl-[acyl-carrier protein] reductase II